VRWSRLFPRQWRERYGDDIDDQLRDSARPVRDRLDIAVSAIGARWRNLATVLARQPRLLSAARAAAGVLVLVGIVGGVWAQARLAHGALEIPGHWWSSLAVAPAVVGATIAALSRRR
jgi:uncharacterized membrane protein YeaQ/YmgE (transglycosylase-associated protein family)